MHEALRAIPESKRDLAVSGVTLDRCLEPQNVEDLGRILMEAARQRSGILIVGGGTRLLCANAAAPIDLGVSTLGLQGVDVFEPEEGVLHVRAGTAVALVQQLVREQGWELPVDVPGASSTVGGVIASAATGPRAQAFGRLADTLLGLEVVGADGVATKCGGRVVKNVTGYDLAKLYCGSFGSLGVVTGAWLRLRPLPVCIHSLIAPLPTRTDGLDRCRDLARWTSVRALTWVEGEAADDQQGVYLELGGSDTEVAHDLAAIESEIPVEQIGVARIDALRDARAAQRGETVALRARVPGAATDALRIRLLEAGLSVSIDLGLGVLHARGSLPNAEALLRLRAAAVAVGGFMTFEAIPESWRDGLDVFGFAEEEKPLMRAILQRFDPHQILNPGRFMACA